MISLREVRLASAKVYTEDQSIHRGVAFLISSRCAITAYHVVKNYTTVTLEFPSGKYMAKVEAVDEWKDCAVLITDGVVEAVTPLRLNFDVVSGDNGYFYGFPESMKGEGKTFDGHIQDSTGSTETVDESSHFLIPSQPFSASLFRGTSGAPLVVGDGVVGVLRSRYEETSGNREFLRFIKIQNVVGLLPNQIIQKIRPDSLNKEDSQISGTPKIVVISALDEELDFLHDMPLNWSEPKFQKNGISYRRGNFTHGVDIISTTARTMGLVPMAIQTFGILTEWSPAVAVLIGLCGGREEKGLSLGDLVVPDQCFHYQFGAYKKGKISRELRTENVDRQIIDIVEDLMRRTQVLAEIRNKAALGLKKPNTILQCHIGPMASADLVVKDVRKLGDAIDADRKTIAVEMESYAFMHAAKLAHTRWAFVVKSVSDFADVAKDDNYRDYAKYTAVNFFVEITRALIDRRMI